MSDDGTQDGESLEGRAALVTGAGRGIGRAVAQRLQEAGMDVLSVDREPADDGPGVPHRADLTDPDANIAAVAAARERFGRLDVVVANAGIQHVAAIDEFPLERWRTIIDLMLTSPFLLAKHAWPALRDSGAGRFIAISSVHGLVASPYKAAYVSAKHGLMGLVKTLAIEGAKPRIAAVAVCPGYVRTPLVEGQVADQARLHNISEDRVLEDVILSRQAVRQLVEPDEVAAVVAGLAGLQGLLFTGTPVTLDYGWTAH